MMRLKRWMKMMKMKNNMRVDSILSFFRKRMVRKPCKTCGKKK